MMAADEHKLHGQWLSAGVKGHGHGLCAANAMTGRGGGGGRRKRVEELEGGGLSIVATDVFKIIVRML